MNIIKKFFSFCSDDNSAIGLCKFSDDFFQKNSSTKNAKTRLKKELSLTEMLKRSV